MTETLHKADIERINSEIVYTMYPVFRVTEPLPDDREKIVGEVQDLFDDLAAHGVTVRGCYDVSGLRADADVMFWFHAGTVEAVQEAYHRLRRTQLGRHLAPVWSGVAVHRPAEFNRRHVPAFLSGEAAKRYVCVYPFVRSYDWYVLPAEERSAMLRDHGMAAGPYPDVRANTIASFALGDYEWILAFEADELHRIVDLMRTLRATDARLHVQLDTPMYTGPRVGLDQLVRDLP